MRVICLRFLLLLAMLLVVAVMVAPNLRGIKTSAFSDKILLVAMCSITVIFILLAIRFLFHYQGWGGLFSTEPFYNPKTFTAHTVWTATSYAALTYIGFEGVTTLAEDAENPKRNVLLAIVLVCLFTGVFGGFLAYLGQRVWPDWRTLPNLETAFMDVCGRVGGPGLFHAMGFTILLADFGGGLAGILGAARLLFGMGRDNVLPRKIFAHLSPGSSTPTYNILIVGTIVFVGAIALQHIGNAFEHAGELLNFGAFFAFHECKFGGLLAIRLCAASQEQGRGRLLILCCRCSEPFSAESCGGIWIASPKSSEASGFLLERYISPSPRADFRTPPRMIDFGESA